MLFPRKRERPTVAPRSSALAAILALVALATAFSSCSTAAGLSGQRELGVDRVRRVEILQPDLPDSLDGYRIAFVSDIHYHNNFSRARLDTLVAAINEERPDCAIVGGDLTRAAQDIEGLSDGLARLAAPDGVYAVSGNHDFYNDQAKTCAALRGRGIVVLDEAGVVTPGGVGILGINEFRDIYPDLSRLYDTVSTARFIVLANHDPDFAEETDMSRFAAVLSGHTHGGQITIFGWAPVLPSAYGQKYRTGTVYKDGTPVVVSNGAGYGGNILRFRFCAPSDFLVVTLRKR